MNHNKSIYDCTYAVREVFGDFRSEVCDLIENLQQDNIYVPFHISDKFYCLKYSENTVEKECEVIEAKVIKITVEVTEESQTYMLRLRATKQPERFLTYTFSQYDCFFFKDEIKAKSKCREVNRMLKLGKKIEGED